MDKRPEEICFVNEGVYFKTIGTNLTRTVLFEKTGHSNGFMSKKEVEVFYDWVHKIEEAAHSEDKLKLTTFLCFTHYGEEKFRELFDVKALKILHQNWIEIAMWESNVYD